MTNYEIYRDGDLLAVIGNVTSYTDTTVSGATLRVHGQGARPNENRSDASNTAR